MKKSKLVVITGSVGAGKSTLAMALCSKFDWKHIDIHQFEKSCGEYNSEKDCYDLDMQLVSRKVKKIIFGENLDGEETVFVFDSHVSHLIDPSLVDFCVVVSCFDLKMLRSRLEERGYSKTKVEENLQCEIMQVCQDEAKEKLGEKGVKIIEVDGSSEVELSSGILEEIKRSLFN